MNRKKLIHLVQLLKQSAENLTSLLSSDDNADPALEIAIVTACNTAQALDQELTRATKPAVTK